MAVKLSTGYVRASGYAHKVRRVLFALARKKVEPKEIIRASAELNQKIFEEFQRLNVSKEDVVRITVEFKIKDGSIVWDYDSLRIEVYRKGEEEKLAKAMEEVEERERELEEKIKAIEEVALNLKKLSDELIERIEELKQEHTSLKLREEL
ncbi:single- stranded DNA-binding family protein [Thermococcus henrietii]|uniref:single- stranded DNA-binding family protein n=1 Tax=Thermococcus henrietii TaxID=2016361 RepID=UPI00156DF0F2|nr:single- stranded DNA-binding family protein [Thermococcus henrietii]